MMRRVSSRQRLVSWDAFDATTAATDLWTTPFWNDSNEEEPGNCPPLRMTTAAAASAEKEVDASIYPHTTRIACDTCEADTNNNLAVDNTEEDPAGSSTLLFKSISSTSLKRKRLVHEFAASPTSRITPTTNNGTHAEKPDALHIIPNDCCDCDCDCDETVKRTEPPIIIDWSTLPPEVRLHLMQFLDVPSLRVLSTVDRSQRQLLMAGSGDEHAAVEAVWKPALMRQWPWLQSVLLQPAASIVPNITNSANSYNDSVARRKEGSSGDLWNVTDSFHSGNYSVLLSMAGTNGDNGSGSNSVPVQIDVSLFVPTRWSRSLRTFRPRTNGTTDLRLLFANTPFSTATGTKTTRKLPAPPCTPCSPVSLPPSSFSFPCVQFTGTVGMGDRCIRSDNPLPRPQLLKQYDHKTTTTTSTPAECSCSSSSMQAAASLLLQRFRESASPLLNRLHQQHSQHQQTNDDQHQPFKPFCAPFISAVGTIDLTPRFVSYYEVSILPPPLDFCAPSSDRHRHNQHRRATRPSLRDNNNNNAEAPNPECVAIGLATSSFCLHSRMPGWDSHSFGYHGDDGGIFHAAGSMIKEYGSHFGVGDTVGCGVDYLHRAIFYTLNGRFLGYAFDLGITTTTSGAMPDGGESMLHVDLYPVIGLDTNCPVSCNFGTSAHFVFDLAGMIAQHESAVRHAMRTKHPPPSPQR